MKMKEIGELDLEKYRDTFVVICNEAQTAEPLEYIASPENSQGTREVLYRDIANGHNRTARGKEYLLTGTIRAGESFIEATSTTGRRYCFVAQRIFVEAVPADMRIAPRPRGRGYWKN
jgi:hypothetical protein